MKFIFFFLLAWPLAALAADPPVALSPIQQAVAKLTADTQAYELAAGSLSTAAAALQAAQANLTALAIAASNAQSAIAADQANLAALVGTVTPGPIVATHTVGILAVTDTATFAPCVKLQPVLDALAKSGVPITYMKGSDPLATSKWNVAATPTLIMTVDGAEPGSDQTHTRIVGLTALATQPTIAKWYADTQNWVKLKYPPKEPVP